MTDAPARGAFLLSWDHDDMGLILLEALGALAVLLIIVWWTMFAGRRGGERQEDTTPGHRDDA
jgi:hypothetical protein